MIPDLHTALAASIKYADENGIDIPASLRLRAIMTGAIKAGGDLTAINQRYHDAITRSLLTYFEGSGSVTAPRNAFVLAMIYNLGSAFRLGWSDEAGGTPLDADAVAWLNSRVAAETGYIDMLFQEARELRKEKDFDFFSWVTMKADGYTRTLREMYNAGALRASKDIMVTFVGEDGNESCPECQMLKGQRHRVSWFVRRNFVPPHGTGLSCHRGRYCQHYLQNDKGEQVTI